MAPFTADWNPFGKDVYFRKFELYSMGWHEQHRLNLADFIVAAAPFGGPIALVRDERKTQKIKIGTNQLIYIFSSCGDSLSTIKWNSGRLIHIAWSTSEDLLCIQEDGTVLVYNIFGVLQYTFSFGQEAKDTTVLQCKVFNSLQRTGAAVLTGTYRIFVVKNIKDPRIRQLAEVPGLEAPPSSWEVVSDEQGTRAVVAKDDKLYVLNQNERSCQAVFVEFESPYEAIIEMAVSFNHQQIALFADNGCLWMGSSDLQRKYGVVNIKANVRPKQLVWCGKKAVIGHWENFIFLVGAEKDYINYSFDSPIYLVPEIDGVRIISNAVHEFLQKVPSVVTEIFRIGSISPGALLLEAAKEYKERSYKADEYLRMIEEGNQLELAIQQCIDAAGHEYQPSVQKKLLRAASFGKSFVPNMDPESYVDMWRTLRVLNAVRHHRIGIPLTYTQLNQLTMQVLLDRLVLRREYYLAIRISKYLKIPDAEGSSRILAHWACYKVEQTQLDSDEVAKKIAEKLESAPGISYSEIANKAVEHGRTQLAIKLLDYEPRASEQVPLLMKLKNDQRAIMKAIESGDTDLVYTVILHLLKTMPVGDFPIMIRNFPAAYALYLKYCKEQDLQKLHDLYYQEDNFTAEADCRIIESYQTKRKEQRIAALQVALENYRKAKDEFSATHTEEQIRLLKYQIKLEEKLHGDYLDQSVHETMLSLMQNGEMKLAEDFRKEFKVPEKRFWWSKIKVLAERDLWMELDKFSKSKKSPIGYEPFVNICLKYKNTYEAKKYLPRVKEESKVKYYVKLGCLEDAAKIAFEQKDEAALNLVLSKCLPGNRAIIDKINSMKAQLGKTNKVLRF